ncbi:LPS-assembly protein [Aliiruegeria haliotis]|uniref:LPS-assembly protein LptD n=1 Tax=Aliiruegeria haliotis TaxID=1280846 RepID=A0A2T0S0A1_9RHOB|nr:LPS assembly protein LptD [Aliiruegeria haliotis]PRY26861.1 LPS-assembly protein [Aliiruegeria haliotis]
MPLPFAPPGKLGRRGTRCIRGQTTIAIGIAAALLAAPATAQVQAPESTFSTLIADRVDITEDGKLVATGNVEALYGDTRIKAGRIIYDDDTGNLQIEGPIVITQGENALVLADSAELSTDLTEGLIRSARVVLDQQLQLAATEINRVSGRYTQLYKTTASSCEVCAAHPVPLWQIRARRVVHDEVERQLYFDDAIFDVVGVPVAYLPRLRLPDPTLDRATGFLTPSLRSTDELGFGAKIPYFIKLGDSRDLTVTPYLSTNRTRTLEYRYREAYRGGDIEVNGAFSKDDIVDDPRAYLFAEGEFRLPRNLKLEFDVELTSDDTYLLDYDYSDKDRLDSALTISRADRRQLVVAELIAYESLRSSEDNETQPFLVGDLTWIEKFQPRFLGGIARFELDGHGHQRNSNKDVVGRDVTRISGALDWRRDWKGPWGVLFSTAAQAQMDHTSVYNDSTYPDDISEFTPYGLAEVRWPWIKQGARAGHVIEPVMQMVWSPDDGKDTPRDESTQLEFDEGNLFSLSRFPAGDALERGLRANIGVSWTRYDPTGWSLGTTVGRILRERDLHQFAGYESLDGLRSDWLAGVQLRLPNAMSFTNRTLFDDAFDVTKNELRFDWENEWIDIGSSYIWMEPSVAEDRDAVTHELTVDGDWQVNDRWLTTVDVRYDIELNRSASARFGLEYSTECATFDFSIRRRFTSSAQIRPTTDYNFEIKLAGFGDTGSGRQRPSRPGCRL